MRKPLLILLVLVAVSVSGCIHGNGPVETQDIRNSFVDEAENISSYSYEGETVFEISGVGGGATQTSTTTTEATLDYGNRELRSETYSVNSGSQQGSNTTTYLVNRTVYEKTVGPLGDSGWVRFENSAEVERTWDARDELGHYTETLRNASLSVTEEGQTVVDGTDAHVLNVELGEDEQVRFLTSKLGDEASFFDDIDIESFSFTVWISEDENHLLRAETNVSMLAPNQQTQAGQIDLEVEASFTDDFSDYDESVEIELPEEARDAETLQQDPEGNTGF